MGLGFSRRRKDFGVTRIRERGNNELSFEDFQILRAIGKGTFGKVCIVQKKDTTKMYAMKYVNKCNCVENDAFQNVLKEINILSALEHPFLVNLWFTFQDEEDMFMVVDLLLGGDLRYHLQQATAPFDEARVKLYLCEIALALDYLRFKHILHRDIKPDNILLDDAGHARVTDFNIATVIAGDEVVTSVSGTKPYMAPEVVRCALAHGPGYSFPADWWSLGVTAYEMICRVRPYEVSSGTSMDEIHQLIHSTCLRFPKSTDRGLVNLLLQLLNIDPHQRISTIEELKSHPFLENTDFRAVYDRQVEPPFIPSKDQLNCDPTFELEEMIIESKPLHKKKKRLSRRNKTRASLASQDGAALQKGLEFIQQNFITYNRESKMKSKVMEEKEKDRRWEEKLGRFTS